MLVLSRRADESIVIGPADGIDPGMTLQELFAKGPIQITLLGGNRPAGQNGHRSPGRARHSPGRRLTRPETSRARTLPQTRPTMRHIATQQNAKCDLLRLAGEQA